MATAYYSTPDLCERFRCSSRTLFRRIQRAINPFPSPCIRSIGSRNLWDAAEISAWEARERERSASVRGSRVLPGRVLGEST